MRERTVWPTYSGGRSYLAERSDTNRSGTLGALLLAVPAGVMADGSSDRPPTPTPNSDVVHLPRGGVWVNTVVGPIQFGIPPETIKDSMILGLEVPNVYVVPTERFNRKIGPNEGVNLAEFEFPAYLNFFMRNKSVNLLVNSAEVRDRIRRVFQETLLGPQEIDNDVDFASTYPKEDRPDLAKELEYFARFGDKKFTLDMLLQFTIFDSTGSITLEHPETGEKVEVVRALTEQATAALNPPRPGDPVPPRPRSTTRRLREPGALRPPPPRRAAPPLTLPLPLHFLQVHRA